MSYVVGLVDMDEKRVREIIQQEVGAYFKSDRVTFYKLIQMLDGRNIQLGIGTGTKIGTAAEQKLGFWGVTPVVQYQPTGVTLGFTDTGLGTLITEQDTFTGNIGTQVYNIGDIVAALKKAGIILS